MALCELSLIGIPLVERFLTCMLICTLLNSSDFPCADIALSTKIRRDEAVKVKLSCDTATDFADHGVTDRMDRIIV